MCNFMARSEGKWTFSAVKVSTYIHLLALTMVTEAVSTSRKNDSGFLNHMLTCGWEANSQNICVSGVSVVNGPKLAPQYWAKC